MRFGSGSWAARQPVPGRARRRTHRDRPEQFLDRARALFFPALQLIVIGIYGLLSLFINMQPYGRLLYALIGVTWAFHFTFTCWMILKNQTDLTDHGTFFSLVVIYLMNLLLLSVMLVVASPQITFAEFWRAISCTNIGNFSH